ncbi:putative bifunctional diguanylate cyclase/phosphodiesterase [Kaarinaea lacus]
MKDKPYIEPTIRTIAGTLLIICAAAAITRPDLKIFWWSFLVFIAINLFQSGLTRFCLMEKILKRAGFRSEMDEIRDLALQDALTNLPNRVLLEDRVEIAINQANRNCRKVAMLFIDLDNFKQINDIQGHKVGDQLLIEVSRALQDKMRPYDTLARWGGDEFVVLLPDLQHTDDARVVAEKLMQSVNNRLESNQNLHTTLSIGIAVYPDDAETTESLFMQADKALFHSKAQGRNNFQVFSEMQESGRGFVDTNITARFTAALKNELLQVHFQPIVDAATHQTVCLEALARWHDNENGWISPGMFIPLAENLGLIEEMGNQILLEAASHFATCPWQDQIQLAVNISHRQLFSRSFVPSLVDLIDDLEIDPHRIKFEITESSALDTEKAQRTLKQLSYLGFTISVDDFGTGFSSLSRLHEMPVKELKIDMSFVRRINTHKGRVMLNTIVNMGKAMHLNLVAEGVEDKETADTLCDMGVHCLQGFYFCPPKPNEDIRDYILQNQPESDNLVSIQSRRKGLA